MRALACRLVAKHQRFIDAVAAQPLLVLPAGLGYLLVIAIFTAPAVALGIFIPRWTGYVSNTVEYYEPSVFAILAVMFFAMAVGAHFLYINLVTFARGMSGKGTTSAGPRVVQLVALSVLYFAIAHYYIALLSPVPAYDGMTLPLSADRLRNDPWPWRFFTPPPLESIIDCLYFSTVTMATVGYGDMHPTTMIAKAATMLEILFSFVLIVVVLGGVFREATSQASRGEDIT